MTAIPELRFILEGRTWPLRSHFVESLRTGRPEIITLTGDGSYVEIGRAKNCKARPWQAPPYGEVRLGCTQVSFNHCKLTLPGLQQLLELRFGCARVKKGPDFTGSPLEIKPMAIRKRASCASRRLRHLAEGQGQLPQRRGGLKA